jgi:ribosomal protein S18 acetylase RimI-like enzyme
MNLERVRLKDVFDFRQMVEAYWQEIMPHSDVVKNRENREAYFQERFPFENDDLRLFWGVVDGRKTGFVAFTVNEAKHSAMIEDFFVAAEFRRQGYGTAMIKAVFTELDQLRVELVELNVRRDNPQALAFWEAQGFCIALHHLRQYRDPESGTAYIGALSSDFTYVC